jgi:kynurenine formamidase
VGDLPSEDEVLSYFDVLSNWGRWGDDDVMGTLNLIGPDTRRRAAACVRSGRSVSCGWDVRFDVEAVDGVGPQRVMLHTGEGLTEAMERPADGAGAALRSHAASEFFGIEFHGLEHTHLDALSHLFWDARMYNGRPAHLVDSENGATVHAVTDAAEGIVTRGVLLDVAALRGVKWLEMGEGIFPDDLEAAERRQGVLVREGDALLLRTGTGRRRKELSSDRSMVGEPGLHAACLPWLRERGVAVLAADVAQDVLPSGYAQIRAPVHAVGIVAMGLWLIDNCDLERLAEVCIEEGRWDFLLLVAPLRLTGGTGSPVNPIAML